MVRSLLSFVFLILCINNLTAQTCGNDSVVTKYYRIHLNDVTTTITTDSFDLSTGIDYNSYREGIDTLPGSPVFSQDTFTRNFISLNANHDTIVFYTLKGTGTGYVNGDKIEFTYNINNQPLTKINYTGSGLAWNIAQTETWTYDAFNRITDYLVTNTTGNVSEKIYTYTGGQAVNLTFRLWSGGAWVNNERYSFTYDVNGIRDSIYVQRWDTISTVWIDSLNSKYDSTGIFTAVLTRWTGPNTKYDYYLDTLNNFNRIVEVDTLFSSTITWQYNYFNSHLKLTSESYHTMASNSSHSYTYNTYGVLIGEGSNSASSMSHSSSSTVNDSLSHPLTIMGGSSSNVSQSDRRTRYYYSSANTISLAYMPIDEYYGGQCQGDSIQAVVIVNGGCGPYHFSWTPSTGLSSDTIAEPKILLSDTVNYQVTVTDTTGHSASYTFLVYSDFSAQIAFDTTLCSGCPVVLSTNVQQATYQWYRNDTLIYGAWGTSYTATNSGSYRVRATTNYCTMLSNPVQLTLSGLTRLSGRVFLDLDSTCTFTPNDRGLYMYGISPYLIKIKRQNYSAYIIPDSNGYYDIPIDTGNFILSLSNTPPIYTPACPDSGIIHVNIPAYGDTITGIDLILKPLYNCQRLRVVVSSNIIRPCQQFNVIVRYFNEGSVDETNPVVDVYLPFEMDSASSSLPFTTLPNNGYSFSLPPMLIGELGQLNLTGNVDCDPIGLQNATFCMSAEIHPIDFCSLQPDSTWDGSNIRVFAECQNPSVCFTIRNDGILPGGNMDSLSEWRLYADNILIQQGSFILNANQDTTLCFAADGRTFRLEADQLPGFPSVSHPHASIERCGTIPYSLNQILLNSPDNNLPFYYTNCAQVMNSFDPNDKNVQPIGITSNNIVNYYDRLKYRIDFQNTGSDTAFKVVIIDNIDTDLDISTLNLIASSHPYHFAIDGSNFVWTFDPIALPDSNVNEPSSHGYIEFSILPKPLLSNGIPVYNQAQIFFDSNIAVNTHWTYNRVCDVKKPEAEIHALDSFCPGQPHTLTAAVIYGGTNPYCNWYLNGLLLPVHNDTITLSGNNQGDSIDVFVQSNYLCAVPNTVRSEKISINYNLPVITFNSPQLISSVGVAYQWYLDGTMIPGAINQSYTPLVSGNYMVKVTDPNGCQTFSANYNYLNTSVEELQSDFSIYPNPVDDYLFISTSSNFYNLTITDMLGREVLNLSGENKNKGNIKIYTRALLTGTYLMKITSGNNSRYKFILIEH